MPSLASSAFLIGEKFLLRAQCWSGQVGLEWAMPKVLLATF